MDQTDTSSTSDKQYSIRVVLPEALYKAIKEGYPEHGQISQLVRSLLIKHIENLPTMGV